MAAQPGAGELNQLRNGRGEGGGGGAGGGWAEGVKHAQRFASIYSSDV